MTAFTTETKSQLAKLLATENIRIEHKKLPTAAFDPKNRVLYCPIWKDMSGYMYDLLMGNEVGHALYTHQLMVGMMLHVQTAKTSNHF